MGLKRGLGIGIQSLHGMIVNFEKEVLLEEKEKEKENLNGQTEEYKRESGKLESSMDFPLRPCRIQYRDFCIVQKDCQIRQKKIKQRVAFMPEYWKTVCQTV